MLPLEHASWITPDGRVADDLACVHCRYNLRLLPADGTCPECSHPVASSRPLAACPPEVLHRLARALAVTAACMLLVFLRGLLMFGNQAFDLIHALRWTIPALGETSLVTANWWSVVFQMLMQALFIPVGLAFASLACAVRATPRGSTAGTRLLWHAGWMLGASVFYALAAPFWWIWQDLYVLVVLIYLVGALLIGGAFIVVVRAVASHVTAPRHVIAVNVLLWLSVATAAAYLGGGTWQFIRYFAIDRWELPDVLLIPATLPAGTDAQAGITIRLPEKLHYLVGDNTTHRWTRVAAVPPEYLNKPRRQTSLAADRISGVLVGSLPWLLGAWWLLAFGVTIALWRVVRRTELAVARAGETAAAQGPSALPGE